MGSLVWNIVGIVAGGAIGFIPFLADSKKDEAGLITQVTVAAGNAPDGISTTGNIPGIRTWDVYGRDISGAYGSNDNLQAGDDGHVITLVAPKSAGGAQAEYISVSAGGNDALCIAFLKIMWPDGTVHPWSGDVGKQCGAQFYPSMTQMPTTDGTPYHPFCIWIDGDGMSGVGPNGITTQGFGIHLTDFHGTKERSAAYANDPDTMCKSKPRFHLYDKLAADDCIPYFNPPLDYQPTTLVDMDRSKVMVDGAWPDCPQPTPDNLPAPNYRRRRSRSQRPAHNETTAFDGILVTSKLPTHSALELCDSENSLGPDFVSHEEGIYCDMRNKQAYSLCDRVHVDNCFDLATKKLVPPHHLSRRDAGIFVEKDYHTVRDW